MQRDGLELELTVFVPPDQPVEIRLLTIRNGTAHNRRFRVVPYLEMASPDRQGHARLLAGQDRFAPQRLLFDPRNDFHQGWALVVTTLAVDRQEHVRERFLGGPERDFTRPHFVERGEADPGVGDDGRRIAAFAGTVEVPAWGESSVAITLGHVADLATAERLAERHASLAVAQHALAETRRFWAGTLGDLRVENRSQHSTAW